MTAPQPLTPAECAALAALNTAHLRDGSVGALSDLERTLLDALDQSRAEALAYADRIAELTVERNEAREDRAGAITEWGIRHSQGIRVERSETTARETLADWQRSDRPRKFPPRTVTRTVTPWIEATDA